MVKLTRADILRVMGQIVQLILPFIATVSVRSKGRYFYRTCGWDRDITEDIAKLGGVFFAIHRNVAESYGAGRSTVLWRGKLACRKVIKIDRLSDALMELIWSLNAIPEVFALIDVENQSVRGAQATFTNRTSWPGDFLVAAICAAKKLGVWPRYVGGIIFPGTADNSSEGMFGSTTEFVPLYRASIGDLTELGPTFGPRYIAPVVDCWRADPDPAGDETDMCVAHHLTISWAT